MIDPTAAIEMKSPSIKHTWKKFLKKLPHTKRALQNNNNNGDNPKNHR